jgi:hypothetical protein
MNFRATSAIIALKLSFLLVAKRMSSAPVAGVKIFRWRKECRLRQLRESRYSEAHFPVRYRWGRRQDRIFFRKLHELFSHLVQHLQLVSESKTPKDSATRRQIQLLTLDDSIFIFVMALDPTCGIE